MRKEDISIRKAIIHILDTFVGEPVLSNSELEFGSEFADFLKGHIAKVMSEDTRKECHFYRDESEVYRWLEEYNGTDFVGLSRKLANFLFEFMSANIDIPSADLAVVQFHHKEDNYIALLKLNYKNSYIHRTMPDEEGGFINEIVRHKNILPSGTQTLSEAAVIRLNDYAIWVTERKYEVNGEKINYFSRLFLKCEAQMTTKGKLTVLETILNDVVEENPEHSKWYAEKMRIRHKLNEAVTKEGGFIIEELADELFKDSPEVKPFIQNKMKLYGLIKQDIKPKEEKTIFRYQQQELSTDTGIEIKIPMEQYKDPDSVQFIDNPNGTVTVCIKDISLLKAKL